MKYNFKNRSSGFFIAPLIAGALISGGAQLLGGALGGIGEDADAKRQERLARQQLEQQERLQGRQMAQGQRQFDQGLEQRKEEFGRTAGMQGLNFLANQRSASGQKARTANFRNDLITASGGIS